MKSAQSSADYKVFISGYDGIPKERRESVLKSFLGQFGKIKDFNIDSRKGHFAVAEFKEQESVKECISNSGHKVCGSNIVIRSYQRLRRKDRVHVNSGEKQRHPPKDTTDPNSEKYDNVMDVLFTAANLEEQLQSLVAVLRLKEEDIRVRQEICASLCHTLSPFFESIQIHQFGSSINNFGAEGCDLDIFLDFESHEEESVCKKKSTVKLPRHRGIKSLKFDYGPLSADQLESMDSYDRVKLLALIIGWNNRIFSNIVSIPSKRCPLVKLCYRPSSLSCDISLNNRKALHNSHLLRLYSTNSVVMPVVMAVRFWAKMQYLCDNSCGISSYALTLLVLFFLMRRQPPVIPAVLDVPSCVEGVRVVTVDSWKAFEIPASARLPRSDNTESPATLLREFFHYYANEVNWAKSVLQTSDATIVCHDALCKIQARQYKIGLMTMVDPFDHSHNVLIRVNERFKHKFIHEMKRAAELSRKWSNVPSPVESDNWGVASLFVPNPNPPDFTHDSQTGNSGKKKGKCNLIDGEDENGNFVIDLNPLQMGHPVQGDWCSLVCKMIINLLLTVFVVDMKEEEISQIDKEVHGVADVERQREGGLIASPVDHRACGYEEKDASSAHSDMSLDDESGQGKDQCTNSAAQASIMDDHHTEKSPLQSCKIPSKGAVRRPETCCSSPPPGVSQFIPKEKFKVVSSAAGNPQSVCRSQMSGGGRVMKGSVTVETPCPTMVSSIRDDTETVAGAKRSSAKACLDTLSPVFKSKPDYEHPSSGGQNGSRTSSSQEETSSSSNIASSKPVSKKVKLISPCNNKDKSLEVESVEHVASTSGGSSSHQLSSSHVNDPMGASSLTNSTSRSQENHQTAQASSECLPSLLPLASKSGGYLKMRKFVCKSSFPIWSDRTKVKNMWRRDQRPSEGVALEREISTILVQRYKRIRATTIQRAARNDVCGRNSISAINPKENDVPVLADDSEPAVRRKKALLKSLKDRDKSKQPQGHSSGETAATKARSPSALSEEENVIEFSCLLVEKCLPVEHIPQVQLIFHPHPIQAKYFKNFFIWSQHTIKRLVSNHLFDSK